MTPQKSKELHLPLARVKTIMKSSPDVEAVSFEASYFVAKSAELFVLLLAKQAYHKGKKELAYKDIAGVVQSKDTLDFLWELMPKKITVRQYKELRTKKKIIKDSSSSMDSEESDSEE